jgi:hypothetical protein
MAIAPNSRSQPERLASDGADRQHPASESGSATLPQAVGNFGAGADDASSLAARKAGGEQQEVTVSAAAEPRSAEAGEADLAGTTLMGRADDYGQGLVEPVQAAHVDAEASGAGDDGGVLEDAGAGGAEQQWVALMGRADDYGQDLPGAAVGQLAQVGDSDDGDVPGL